MLKKSLLLVLPLLALSANAWVMTVYPDSECESTPSGAPSGTGDQDCTATPANHRGVEVSQMGNCVIYLAATMDDCENENFEQDYDATVADICIPPDFQWDAYAVQC